MSERIKDYKKYFPVFEYYKKKNKPLIYLDTGASSLKPKIVIDRINKFYKEEYANIHRGLYELSEKSTELYEESRERIATYFNVRKENIIFVKGTTDAINSLVRALYFSNMLKEGDEIITSIMEHHANFLPWKVYSKKLNLKLKIIPVTNYKIDIDKLKESISKKTKIVTLTHVSNVLGTINNIKLINKIIREKEKEFNNKIFLVVDGAQAVPHLSKEELNLKELGVDAYAFSFHKCYGPTGIGVLYLKNTDLKPFDYGGDMIKRVTLESFELEDAPQKFEAGTPNLASVVALKETINFLEKIDRIKEKETAIYLYEKLSSIKEIKIIGLGKEEIVKNERTGVFSFNIEGIHPHDIAAYLAEFNICIRAGAHCAMPLVNHLGYKALSRASLGCYNNKEDVDFFIKKLEELIKIFY